MRVASLGSGSRGNATLVEEAQTCVLIDNGFSLRETVRRLARLGKQPNQLDAILVTHEHSDHISGVAALARKHGIPVYLTPGTWRSERLGEVPELHPFNCHARFAIKDLWIQPVPVPHDAREPCQFIFDNGDRRLGVLTDLGSITPHVEQCYQACDALLLECNHDPRLLAQGPYPPVLKRRVGGAYGHLSNQQAAGLLQQLDQSRLQHVIATHISEKNNDTQLAATALADVLNCEPQWITLADQETGFAWRTLA